METTYLGLAIGAYILGSVPFGLLASWVYGSTDPRTAGSQNIGFTNVLRTSGTMVGILTLLGDFGKGWLVGWSVIAYEFHGALALGIGFCVIIGHIFSLFLGFRGGKGVATTFGCLLGMAPSIGFILIVVWLAVLGLFRYSSGAAIVTFMMFPLIAGMMITQLDFTIFSICVSGLVLYKHKENFMRLCHGTESRMKFGSS
ncbi:MAG: glycerol-3-phosphate 1-O-acyltransferase PlsY [Nitrospirales bacterium]|nr:glycerol-3-phosphate 1-O-acyltransferase PlsY [Nitrospirales bacterium]